MNEHEIARIAAAFNQLRPDWPTASLRTILNGPQLRDRPRRDIVVALGWVACESGTHTPARVLEAGPWWKAAAADGNTSSNRDNPPKEHRCSVCSLSKERCAQVWGDDHDFIPASLDRKRAPDAMAAIVEDARQRLEKTPEPSSPIERTPDPRVDAIRNQLANPTKETTVTDHTNTSIETADGGKENVA